MANSSEIYDSRKVSLTLDSKMKLTSSASEQNVYFTYVCLVNDIKPSNTKEYSHNKPHFHLINHEIEEADEDSPPIQVERSKALHELVERHKQSEKDLIVGNGNKITDSSAPPATTSGKAAELPLIENTDSETFENPNILKLTKMKWLTEDQENAPDSSSPSLSPTCSDTSSNFSEDSEENLNKRISLGDKYLSTIIQLDKEHNMFGLSNITIVGSRQFKRVKKDDERPVFHQTAIVQICCKKGCCKHRSNTDLPGSLKCGGCRGCCIDPICSACLGPCGTPCLDPPCQPLCVSCPKGKCSCKMACPPVKCMVNCSTCFGFKVALKRKPKYVPSPVELTPRSSCVLQKPLAARSCHHLPQCVPPSSYFPYLMPCFWPARPSAPCSTPAQCFHNPPCPPARIRRSRISPGESCPRTGKCEDPPNKTKCSNPSCLGTNSLFKKEFESRFGKKIN